jgi:calcineurin-binding protein cabin-1
LTGNPIDNFLDDPNLCEDKLSEEAGSEGFLETITKTMFPDVGGLGQYNTTLLKRYTFTPYCFFFHTHTYIILNLFPMNHI